jgi:TPP-dependent pyruvate/acetoin dehydrogenase alpha subunit
MLNFIKKNPDIAKELLCRMIRIRMIEEEIADRYPKGKMRCPTHLCIGQEAVSASVGLLLGHKDFAMSSHRAHGHYLGKGGDLKKMLSEIYGKSTGCSKGMGGSMHLIDRSVGFMGSTAIVGGTIPVGVGLGLSIKLRNTDQISCVFLGDGATEEGVFYESVNFAVLKKLPVLFICENNLYSVYTHLHSRRPKNTPIHEMVSGLGIKSYHGDGNDAIEIYRQVLNCVESLRQGTGPYFFEFDTYRWREHCGPNYDNNIGYRSEDEFLAWKEKDPIIRLKKLLFEEDCISKDSIQKIEDEIRQEINEAFEYAENSPFPDEDEAFKYLYKD